MKFKEFRERINRIFETLPSYAQEALVVQVILSSPSIGSRAATPVISVNKGIDWENGKVLITTEERIVIKKKEEDIFDAARDLLLSIAIKPNKRKSYEIREAQRILKKFGHTDETFIEYRKFFHKN